MGFFLFVWPAVKHRRNDLNLLIFLEIKLKTINNYFRC